MALESLHALLLGPSDEFCFCAVTKDVKDDVHPATRTLLDLCAVYTLCLAVTQGVIDLFRFASVDLFVVLYAAEFLGSVQDEARDVERKDGRCVVETDSVCDGLVSHGNGHGRCTECCCCVDVDETVVADDEDGEACWADVLLCAGKDEGVICEAGDGAGHEGGGVVRDEREEGVGREAVEREGGGGGGVVGELDTIDGLVLAVVDQRGVGRERVLRVRRDPRECLAGLAPRVCSDVHPRRTQPLRLLASLFAPGAGEDIVENRLGVVRVQQTVAGEKVVDDSRELSCTAALSEEDVVRGRDAELGADQGLCLFYESGEFLGAVGDLCDADAGAFKVEQGI